MEPLFGSMSCYNKSNSEEHIGSGWEWVSGCYNDPGPDGIFNGSRPRYKVIEQCSVVEGCARITYDAIPIECVYSEGPVSGGGTTPTPTPNPTSTPTPNPSPLPDDCENSPILMPAQLDNAVNFAGGLMPALQPGQNNLPPGFLDWQKNQNQMAELNRKIAEEQAKVKPNQNKISNWTQQLTQVSQNLEGV